MSQHQLKASARRRHQGFVLLLTLVLLMLAALAMVAISRAAIDRVAAADEAQTELQRRWGMASCQTVLLPEAELILHAVEVQQKQPVSSWRQSISLGDQNIDLLLGDESAKANVSVLIERQDRQQATLTIRRLSLASPVAGNVHLRWEAGHAGPESFADVFDGDFPKLLCCNDAGATPVELLTCWGDGRLNIHRAPETIMREVCTGILNLTQIHELVTLQHSQPDIALGDALGKLQLSQQARDLAEQALTDRSSCYSLWVNARTARRSGWALAVEISDPNRPQAWQVRHFEW